MRVEAWNARKNLNVFGTAKSPQTCEEHDDYILPFILLIVFHFAFGLEMESNLYQPIEATSDSFVPLLTETGWTQTVCAYKCQVLVDETDGVRAYQ